jgi:hypothetical protein
MQAAPICLWCDRFRNEGLGSRSCDAFPGQIPDVIWKGKVDHTKAVAGDHGLRYAPQTPDELPGYWRESLKGVNQ